jgi:hypothetical protein
MTETTDTEHPGNRRDLIRKAAIIGGATIAGGAVLARPASAADGDTVTVGGTFTGNTPTELYYSGSGDLPAGPSVISGGEDNSPLQPLFQAGVGGYGVDKVKNGVHGSTAVAGGYGVVAANGAAPADGSVAPKALVVASLGSQVQFLTPGTVAAAAGVAGYPATIGPSKGTHVPGELYVDDAFNLWFAVPGAAPGSVRWVKLAGQQTSGSFAPLPVPVRILDTRQGGGPKVPSGVTVTVSLAKAINGAASGLPAGATAALVNLTVAATEGSGYHTAYSADATLDPVTGHSSVNWDASDQTRANLAVSVVGSATADTAGAIKLTSGGGGSTHLIIDLIGYYL